MLRRVVMMIAGAALLAGCGGGSGSDAAKPTTKPAPKVYTLKQLEAAMPTVDDIPGATKISLRCPQDKQRCQAYDQGMAVINAAVDAASPVGAEQVQAVATPMDFVAVHGQRHADAAAATAAVDATRKISARYVGAYDLPKRKSGSGTVPAVRGKGALAKQSIDAWTGMVAERTEIASRSKSDEGIMAATVHVASARTSVTVFVSLSAAGREPGAATELADSLVRSYLQRLG